MSRIIKSCPYPECENKEIPIPEGKYYAYCDKCNKFVVTCEKCKSINRIDAIFCRCCGSRVTFNTGALYYEPKVNHRKNGIVGMRFENFEIKPNYNWKLESNPIISYNSKDFDISSNWVVGYDHIIYLLSNTTPTNQSVKDRYELCLYKLSENKPAGKRFKLDIEDIEELSDRINLKECSKEIRYDFQLYLYYGRIYILTPYRIIEVDYDFNNPSTGNSLKCIDKYSSFKDIEFDSSPKNYISSNLALTPYCFIFAVKNEERQLSRIVFLDSAPLVKNQISYVMVKDKDRQNLNLILKSTFINKNEDYEEYKTQGTIASIWHDGISQFYFAANSSDFTEKPKSQIQELKIDFKDDSKKVKSCKFLEFDDSDNVNFNWNCQNVAFYQDKSFDENHRLLVSVNKGYFNISLKQEWQKKFEKYLFFKDDSIQELKEVPSINAYIGSGTEYKGTIYWRKNKELAQSRLIQITGAGNFKFISSSEIESIKEIESEIITINFKYGESGCIFVGNKNSSEKILFLLMPGNKFFEELNIINITGKIRNVIYLDNKIFLLSNSGLYCMQYNENEDITVLKNNRKKFIDFCRLRNIPESEYKSIADMMLMPDNINKEEIKKYIEKIKKEKENVILKIDEHSKKIINSENNEINVFEIEQLQSIEKGIREFLKEVPEKYMKNQDTEAAKAE